MIAQLAHYAFGGAPEAVLLHGYLGSARNLTTLCKRLAGSFGVMAFDLLGHGASPPLPRDASLRDIARAVLGTMSALGLPPVRLIGHSLGGRVALTTLLEGGAAALTGITLLDVAPAQRGPNPDTVHIVTELAAAPAEAASREELGAALQGKLRPETIDWLLTSTLRGDDGRVRWRFDRVALAALLPRMLEDDLWPVVDPSVRCIRGSKSRYVSEADVARFRSLGCGVDTVEGAGHYIHVDRLEELALLLTHPPYGS